MPEQIEAAKLGYFIAWLLFWFGPSLVFSAELSGWKRAVAGISLAGSVVFLGLNI